MVTVHHQTAHRLNIHTAKHGHVRALSTISPPFPPDPSSLLNLTTLISLLCFCGIDNSYSIIQMRRRQIRTCMPTQTKTTALLLLLQPVHKASAMVRPMECFTKCPLAPAAGKRFSLASTTLDNGAN